MSSSSDYVYDDDDDDDEDLNEAIAASLLDVGTKHGHVVNPTKKKTRISRCRVIKRR